MDNWELVYQKKEQLNRYPYTEVVSFCMRSFLHQSNEQKVALDVGSGSGVHCKFLSDLGFNVIGIEGSEAAVKNAKALFPSEKITYKRCKFDNFDGCGEEYHFILDRLSTTHSSLNTTHNFYQNLKKYLAPGAKVLWQGFAWCNTARKFGVRQPNGSYNNFTSGILKDIAPAVFYQRYDLENIFNGYTIQNITLNSAENILTGYNHSFWTLEAVYDYSKL